MTDIAEEGRKPPAWKRCGSCGLVKLLEDFPTVTERGVTYRRSKCKKCMVAYGGKIAQQRKTGREIKKRRESEGKTYGQKLIADLKRET